MRGTKWLLTVSLTSSFLISCTPATPLKNSINKTDEAIIGGLELSERAPAAESIVAVYDAFMGQLCTGTLIHHNIVLTAAHCIGMFAEDMYIFFETEVGDNSVPYAVDKIEINPVWSTRKFEHKDKGDLAILRFVGKAPTTKRPAQFLTYTKFRQLSCEDEVLVAGYGLSDGVSGDGAGKLRSVNLQISEKFFSSSESLVNQRSGKGTCHGDSGGPAFVQLGDRVYLWGVISRGVDDKDNECNQQAAITQVYMYKPWINRMIKKLSTSILDPLIF